MSERRLLKAGVKPPNPPVDPVLEKQFVFGAKSEINEVTSTQHSTPSEAREWKGKTISRSPLTTRIRSDFAAALKRASLERQLDGVEPSAILDILEEALEPWLRKHGYIS